jgi:amidase
MARSVADAVAILTIIAGRDPLDCSTLAQPAVVPDFLKALVPNGLEGVRLGVPRLFFPDDDNINTAFNATLDVIRGLGATVIDPAEFPDAEELLASKNEGIVLRTDLKVAFSEVSMPGLDFNGLCMRLVSSTTLAASCRYRRVWPTLQI